MWKQNKKQNIMTTTNTITAANIQKMKYKVLSILGLNSIYSLMDIENAMLHFEYESEIIETSVFNFMRSELHKIENEANKFFLTIK